MPLDGAARPGLLPFCEACLAVLKEKAAVLTLLTHRWLPGAGPRAAVASGRGPGRDLCSGGRDPSEAPGLKQQAVARGTSLAWDFRDPPSSPNS